MPESINALLSPVNFDRPFESPMPNRLFGSALSVLLLLPWLSFASSAPEANTTGWQSPRARLRPHYRASQPSQRLLQSALLAKSSSAFTAAGLPDTLAILALRVEFQRDASEQTTGDGGFMLAADPNKTIDPPPHNRAYFAAQLTALANYYKNVSQGKVTLTFEVWPNDDNAGYQLAQEMKYYGPGRDSAVRDQRLAELLRDAIHAADAAGGVDFSRFDSFIIFHAGIGEDFDEEIDNTPNDISSAFLNLNDLRKELGNNDPGYRGIAVQNGAFFIEDGIILPETQSREIVGSGLIEFGLLGTSTLMFGYQLGLPNLFNTETGASGIGQFGLMDQGSNNYQGLIPAQPEAWSKVFLGWEEPVVITRGENFEIAAALANNPNKIYKIPITDSEYFLLENRLRDVNGDRIASGRDVNGVRIQFRENDFAAEQAISVITQVDEYDFGLPYTVDQNNRALPGPGILIWHIDENIIRANYASNRVNADADHRGVDLEEADGAQDIGRFYGFLDPGSGSELGLPEDAWWSKNPVITEFLRPNEPVSFGPKTIPSTAANNGSNTGIVITNFSDIAPVMTFSLRNQFAVPNFPQFAGGSAAALLSPMLADLTGDGRADIVAANVSGEIFAWQADGSKVIANGDVATITQPNGLTAQIPRATFAVAGPLASPPALADMVGDGRAEVIALLQEGKLQVWQAKDDDGNGRADLAWQVEVGATQSNAVVRVETKNVFCGNEAGTVYSFTGAGELRWQAALQRPMRGVSLLGTGLLVALDNGSAILSEDGAVIPINLPLSRGPAPNGAYAIADIDNDGQIEGLVAEQDGRLFFPTNQGAEQVVLDFGDAIGGLAIGDINRDGRKEVVLAAGNQLFAVSCNGVLTENFPRKIGAHQKTANAAQDLISPIIADVDGDGGQDVLVTGVDGSVYAYRGNGALLEGFPLALPGPGRGSLAAGDLDNDGKLELVGVSGSGFVHVWRLPESSGQADWLMYHRDAAQTSLNPARETPVIAEGKLMPEQSVYNYPNPAREGSTRIRYRLNGTAKVKISIFDTAGDLVTEFEGPGLAQADNEVEWQLNGVQSGVYLAKVEAQGDSEKVTKVIKIAVVK